MIKLALPFLFLVFSTFSNCNKETTLTPAAVSQAEIPVSGGKTNKAPKNIILCIGDGMGLGQITGGLYSNSNKLELERFPVIGLHKNHASNKLITDSAAAATAFSCGKKTYNGAIGVDSEKRPCKTVLEMAQEKGMATGLVTTSTIVHATPASFAAHQPQRRMYEEIALDMSDSGVDYMVGGGKKFFDRREDERDLLEEMRNAGYTISDYFEEDFSKTKIPLQGKFGFLTADNDPLPLSQGRKYFKRAALSALPFLHSRSDNGFFLMIEGAQIDWGGHSNEGDYIVSELLEFDEILGKVLDFAAREGNTLVVVTADHETGGYSIIGESKMDSLEVKFTTGYHSATMVPVFAYGPGSEEFSGIYDNTAIFDKLVKLRGL
ncbi:MAG: alkaline phosphatase [Saprospiraceae bacterium]|nr:alkaline phosphatase [Saprospiraceae bacterium]